MYTDSAGNLTPSNASEREELEGYNKVPCQYCMVHMPSDALTLHVPSGLQVCIPCLEIMEEIEKEANQ